MIKIFMSRCVNTNMLFSLEIKRVLCAYVQSVRFRNHLKISGEHAHIVKIVKKSIGETGFQKIKNPILKQEKINGLIKILDHAQIAESILLERRKITAPLSALSLSKLIKMKMDVGNGKEISTLEDMDILQIIPKINELWLIGTAIQYTRVRLQLLYMYAINAIIQNVVRLTICFWEQIKTICKIAKTKVEQLKALKLLDKVKLMEIPFSLMSLFYKSESFVWKVLKIEKFLIYWERTSILFFRLIQSDTEGHGSISKGATY